MHSGTLGWITLGVAGIAFLMYSEGREVAAGERRTVTTMILLGLYTANGEVPGLDDETAGRFADAHPPAMVIGYQVVAGFGVVEWLLHDDDDGRAGSVQMWLLFVAGIVINIAFVTGTDEQLAGPANLLMIGALLTLLWRSRSMLTLDGWRGAGVGLFPRFALLFLVVYLVLLTVLVSWIIRDVIDFEVLTESQEGLLLAFDHTMFIGVMTNIMFGVLALRLTSPRVALANKVLWGGVNVGLAGFALGLLTTTSLLKQIFAPIMGLSLLFALVVSLTELRATTVAEPTATGS